MPLLECRLLSMTRTAERFTRNRSIGQFIVCNRLIKHSFFAVLTVKLDEEFKCNKRAGRSLFW